ncbi:Inactive homolog of metal-dependent proteases,putative molecular chaperone [Helicobacter bizzozeronii CCUG 35545]|nr:Inactive homolog of metal-dependent proteases,putative molecular chaperone [Helicobacter bizzozeronii CCUG 35545]
MLVLALQSPIKVGVYDHQGSFLHAFQSPKQASFALAEIFDALLAWTKDHQLVLQAIYYAKGPGSLMAMKLAHVFLHTFSLVRSLELYSALGFAFNNNAPIKAFGKMGYVLEGDQIRLVPCDSQLPPLNLPKHLDRTLFTQDNQPIYLLPPV